MVYDSDDTIVAVGTAACGAARGMVRLSGPQVLDCVSKCFTRNDDGPSLFAVDVAAESGRLYTARSSTLHDVDPVALVSDASVAVGADIRGVTVNEPIGRVFASSNDDATVSVVDLDTFSVVTTVCIESWSRLFRC